MQDGEPRAGQRTKIIPPEYAGSDVYYSLYLPEQHESGSRYPVIVEYTGNYWPPSGSSGKVKDANLGYAIARKLGAIWLGLPYVKGKESVLTWWGSELETTQYALTNIRRVCEQYGGNPSEIFICGFSRGAIGVNYLGLYNEEIADVWLGFFSHDHYDGLQEWKGQPWGSPLARYREDARTRIKRMTGRAALISSRDGLAKIRDYLEGDKLTSFGQFSYLAPQIDQIIPGIPTPDVAHPHTDKWLLYPSPDTETALSWFAEVLANKPGTFTIAGTVRDATGQPLADIVVNSGPTHFAVTDQNGWYQLKGLRAGPRQIEAGGTVKTCNPGPELIGIDFSIGTPIPITPPSRPSSTPRPPAR